MLDHRRNARQTNQKSLWQIMCLVMRLGWGWVRLLVRHYNWLRVLCWWPQSGGWSVSRDTTIMLGRKGCWWTTIAGNDHVIINAIVIVCQDLEGVVVLCQTLVHNR